MAVDDLELLGADGWLVEALVKALEGMRDRPMLLVSAGQPERVQVIRPD